MVVILNQGDQFVLVIMMRNEEKDQRCGATSEEKLKYFRGKMN